MPPRADYEHWNEERDIVWWQEEGRHADDLVDSYDPWDDPDLVED